MAAVVCGSGAVTVITLMIVSAGGRMRVYRLNGSFMHGAIGPVCDISPGWICSPEPGTVMLSIGPTLLRDLLDVCQRALQPHPRPGPGMPPGKPRGEP